MSEEIKQRKVQETKLSVKRNRRRLNTNWEKTIIKCVHRRGKDDRKTKRLIVDHRG